MKKMIGMILMSTALFSLSGCSGTAEKDVSVQQSEVNQETDAVQETDSYTVTDVRGKEITFEAVPERIATIGKPMPSIYYAVEGASDHVVGCNPSSISAYNESVLKYMYPQLKDAQTDWCNSNSTVNIEELLKLKPDVVFCYSTAEEEIEKMEQAGLTVVALRSAEMESIKENLRIISAVCQKPERGEELIAYIEEQIEEVTSVLQDMQEEEKTTAIEFYSDMKVAVNQYEHWMTPSGAKNPAAELEGSMADVDMEQLLIWDPEIIYLGNHSDLMPSDLLENKQDGRDWSIMKAVQDGQVYKIPIGAYRWDPAGVETPLMIKWAAKIQYPELFEAMDMEQEVKDFFEYVYQFELTEEMVSEILEPRY